MTSQHLTLLRAVVAAKIAYWDRLDELEKAIAPNGEFSDRATNAVEEDISALATGASTINIVTEEHVDHIRKLAELE